MQLNHSQLIKKLITPVFIAAAFTVSAQNKAAIFTAKVFTPPNSFTPGVEGPAVDKDGNLYAVNFDHDGTIGKVTTDGKASVFIELPAGSIGNGIRFNSHGDMLIADYTHHNIIKVNMATKEQQIFAHEDKMSQPNDIAIDKYDRLYASDPNWKAGTGRVWRIDTDGKVTLLLDSMATVNGIEVSANGKTLYVNELRKIWAYNLSKKGGLSNKRLLIEFTDFGMDGMRCDVKGNVYQARYGKGTIAIVSPKGKLLQEVKLTGQKPTNVAFGGPDGKTMYITSQDQKNIETFRVNEPGREWQMTQKQK